MHNVVCCFAVKTDFKGAKSILNQVKIVHFRLLVRSITDSQDKWSECLLFRKVLNVFVDAVLAENLSKQIPVGEVCLERGDHLDVLTSSAAVIGTYLG